MMLIAVAMTTVSIWNTFELVRGPSLSIADQLRVVMASLPSEPCLVAVVGLLLLHTTQLITRQPATTVSAAALIVGRVLAAVYVIAGIGAATDVVVRKSKSIFPAPFRGPSFLAELSIATLGGAAWLIASSDTLPRGRRLRSKRVEIEVAGDG
jgi:hypothetical protein